MSGCVYTKIWCKLPEIIGTRRKSFTHGTVNINFKNSGVEQFLKGWIKAVSFDNCKKACN